MAAFLLDERIIDRPKKAAVIGLPRQRRCSAAQVNYRAWTTQKDEVDGNSNEHLFGDKMRFIVERFRSRALREVLDQIVRFD